MKQFGKIYHHREEADYKEGKGFIQYNMIQETDGFFPRSAVFLRVAERSGYDLVHNHGKARYLTLSGKASVILPHQNEWDTENLGDRTSVEVDDGSGKVMLRPYQPDSLCLFCPDIYNPFDSITIIPKRRKIPADRRLFIGIEEDDAISRVSVTEIGDEARNDTITPRNRGLLVMARGNAEVNGNTLFEWTPYMVLPNKEYLIDLEANSILVCLNIEGVEEIRNQDISDIGVMHNI